MEFSISGYILTHVSLFVNNYFSVFGKNFSKSYLQIKFDVLEYYRRIASRARLFRFYYIRLSDALFLIFSICSEVRYEFYR